MAWVLVNLSFMTHSIFCHWYYYQAIHFSHDSVSVALALPNLVVAFNLHGIIQLSRKCSVRWEAQCLFNDGHKEWVLISKNIVLSTLLKTPFFLRLHYHVPVQGTWAFTRQVSRWRLTGRYAETVDTEWAWPLNFMPFPLSNGNWIMCKDCDTLLWESHTEIAKFYSPLCVDQLYTCNFQQKLI